MHAYVQSFNRLMFHLNQERRTRISGKLKTLQDLVPNMDKVIMCHSFLFTSCNLALNEVYVDFFNNLQQTSYADMLELAVKHIKGLQNEVEVRRTLNDS